MKRLLYGIFFALLFFNENNGYLIIWLFSCTVIDVYTISNYFIVIYNYLLKPSDPFRPALKSV